MARIAWHSTMTTSPAATRGFELRRGDDLRGETKEGEQRRRRGDGARVMPRRGDDDIVFQWHVSGAAAWLTWRDADRQQRRATLQHAASGAAAIGFGQRRVWTAAPGSFNAVRVRGSATVRGGHAGSVR
jgi:hypothetical protein